MKIKHQLLLTIILVWCVWTPRQLSGQPITTMGTEFWVGFGDNFGSVCELSLLVSGPTATTGYVSGNGVYEQFAVTPGQVTSIPIPSHFQTSNDALYVATEAPVSLYASNFYDATFDATGVLPTAALGSDYVVQSKGYEHTADYFFVIVVEDSTVLHFLYPGFDMPVTWAPQNAGTLIRMGGSLQSNYSEISGTRVYTDNCKPIAVFTGAPPLYIPDQYPYADHLFEQSIPTHCWGRHFVITTSKLRTHDIVRVTSMYDSTTIRYGGQTVTLSAQETHEFDIRSDTVAAMYLESDKAVSVFLYLTSYTYGGENGDPAMCVIHPIEQQMSEVTFATYNTPYTDLHFVNVTFNSNLNGDIYLDGIRVSDTSIHPVPGHPDYSYAKLTVHHGSHTLSAPHGGFNAHVYGLGNCESYAYSLGASLEPINAKVWLNDILSTQLNDTNSLFCAGDTLHFRAMVVNEDITQITWNFSDGNTANGLTTERVFEETGDYLVTVSFSVSDTCWGVQQQTVTMPIHIMTREEIVIDTAVCGEQCVWRDSVYREPGRFTLPLYPSTRECVPLITLNITQFFQHPKPSIEIGYDCEQQLMKLSGHGNGDLYRWSCTPTDASLAGQKNDSVILVSSDIERLYQLYMSLSSDSLCSGTTQLRTPVIPPFEAHASADNMAVTLNNPDIHLHDNSVGSAGRSWFVNDAFYSDQQNPTLTYPMEYDSVTVWMDAYNSYGCHDRDTLTLRIRKEAIWVPNIFTPDIATNSLFMVKGLNIGMFEIWIYTREGQLVWHSDNMDEGWDGTHNGNPLPSGTYVYRFRYATLFEPECVQNRAGTVTLLR